MILFFSQKKFRAIVKSAGLDLVEGRVVGDSRDGNAAPAGNTSSTPAKKSGGKVSAGTGAKKTTAKKATAGPATNKKRKITDSAGDSGADEGQDTNQTIKEEIKKEDEKTPEPVDDNLGD